MLKFEKEQKDLVSNGPGKDKTFDRIVDINREPIMEPEEWEEFFHSTFHWQKVDAIIRQHKELQDEIKERGERASFVFVPRVNKYFYANNKDDMKEFDDLKKWAIGENARKNLP